MVRTSWKCIQKDFLWIAILQHVSRDAWSQTGLAEVIALNIKITISYKITLPHVLSKVCELISEDDKYIFLHYYSRFFLLQFVSYVEIIKRQLYIIDSKPCEQITWRELTSMLRWPAVPRSMLSCCCTVLHCTCRGLSAVRTLLHPLLAEPYAEGGLVQTVRTGLPHSSYKRGLR